MVDEAIARLKKFKDDEALQGAFIATRSGTYVAGEVPERMHRDTYVAMTAIIQGGAETLSMEMRAPMDHIIVRFSTTSLLIISLGNKGILALVGTSHKLDPAFLTRAKELARALEAHIR